MTIIGSTKFWIFISKTRFKVERGQTFLNQAQNKVQRCRRIFFESKILHYSSTDTPDTPVHFAVHLQLMYKKYITVHYKYEWPPWSVLQAYLKRKNQEKAWKRSEDMDLKLTYFQIFFKYSNISALTVIWLGWTSSLSVGCSHFKNS